MSDILTLTPADQALRLNRLISQLSGALSEGVDLGPRIPHIQAGGHVLAQQILELREQIAAVYANPLTAALLSPKSKLSFETWFERLDTLALIAKNFSK